MEETQYRGSKRRRLNDKALLFQPCPVDENFGLQEQDNAGWWTMNNEDHSLYADCIPQTEIETVCFGVIPNIAGRCDRLNTQQPTFPVQLESSDRFIARDFAGLRGMILSEHGQMIQGLLDDTTLTLYVSCTHDPEPTNQRTAPISLQSTCILDITVYGPFEIFEQIGIWFEEYDVYLQDPRMCHLDVKYCNPQRLSSDDFITSPLVSEVVSQSLGLVHLQDVVERPDLLDLISGQDDLKESPQPTLIKATLKRHQKQALTFMLRREQGWSFDTHGLDIWEAADTSQGRFYLNRISETDQLEPPPQFSGGIIADPMGLGKTLTMISLAAHDLVGDRSMASRWDEGVDDKPHVAATLIIVPQPLLGVWEEQIREHVIAGGLKFRRHHLKSRLNEIHDIEEVNIVLTTYQTLSADWKSWKTNENHIIFAIRWRRIILDEAHVIRNMKSRMAHAICDLDAISRWAVTGTPIQNHLSDLTALLKFIRAYPYDKPKRFDADITRLWKSGKDEEAVTRLKRLSRYLILRRAKSTINLLPRRDTRCSVEFNKRERALYDTIRQQTIAKIDDALLHESELSTSGKYVNFLQQIESLRLVCNLGIHYHTRHNQPSTKKSEDWTALAQEMFNIQRGMGTVSCSQCSSVLEHDETLLDDPATQESPLFSRCLKYACANCSYKLKRMGREMVCGDSPLCPIAPVSISNAALEEMPSHVASKTKGPSAGLPSKIEVLIADLKSLAPDVKCIVFSTWRLTLDIIEAGLAQADIRSVRFDGKVPQTQRQSVLNQFKSDPNVRVMLLTLSCGAVGLTLTEASRAYLMEPHWNPTIEEQALARIDRIGQTRQVTTVRFYIRDSFEERVMEVQESKKNLAGVLLSGHDGGHADDSLGALQRLRALL